MRTLLLIYAMRLRAVRNSLFRRGKRHALGWILVLLAVAVVDVTVYQVAPRTLDLVGAAQPGARGVDTVRLFSTLISFFNISFAMLLLASFPLTVGTYTYKSDLSILLPTPLNAGVVFAEKLLTGMLRQYILVVPLMGPFLLGLGVGLHLPAGFFVFSVLAMLLMPIIPTCLGAILTFVFLTVFPPARARTLVTVGGAILGAAFYLSQEIIWSNRSSPNLSQATGLVDNLHHEWLGQLPPSWPAAGLTLAADQHFIVSLGYALCFAVVGVAAFAVAIGTALRTFSGGWANFQEATRLTEPLRLGDATPGIQLIRRPLFGLSHLLPKEWLVFARDPQQWAALILPLGVSVYFSYTLIFRFGTRDLQPGLRFLLAVAGMNFLTSSLVAPLSLTIINRESRTFILLRTWPVTALAVLRDKFLSIYMPLLIAMEGLVVVITIGDRLSWDLAALAAVGAALFSGSLIGWSMVLSLLFPRLDWTNITQMSTWQAWLLSFIGGTILGILEAALLAIGPLSATAYAGVAAVAPILTAVGFAFVLLITGVIGGMLFIWGPRKLSAMEIR
ncbi:MAG: putative ABC transporter permease subunit [Chloroflexota bacterium]